MRNFLVWAAIVFAACTPAWGQTDYYRFSQGVGTIPPWYIHGTISVSPDRIDKCDDSVGGPWCGLYLPMTVVTLTPIANPGYTFDHWEGDLTGNDAPATLTLDRDDLYVNAVFVGGVDATRSFWHFKYRSPGAQDVTITIREKGSGAIGGLMIAETIPSGWTFTGVVGGEIPDVASDPGATDLLFFQWETAPALPMQLTYRLEVPADESGGKEFSGEVFYAREGVDTSDPVRALSVLSQRLRHSADYNPADGKIGLPELLRAIQFYNSGGYHPDPMTADGYAPGPAALDGAPHDADYSPQNWKIGLPELLRVIQFYNSGGYHVADATADGFAPGH